VNFLFQNSSYLIIILSVILIFSFRSQYLDNYEQINKKVIQLSNKGKYKEAISLLENISDKFPEKDYEISQELAFLYSKIGQQEKSIKIWESGHHQGFFYDIFPHFKVKLDSAINYLQTSFPILKGAYLGQKKPEKNPEIFAPGIVSTSGKEFAGTFTPDGKEFYFTRSGGVQHLNTNTIMVTKIVNEKWTEPEIASFSGQYFDFEPYITPDGKKLYFGSRRPVNENRDATKLHQWYLERSLTGWSGPKLIEAPFVDLPVMYISVAKNKNLYFSVDTKEAGIWVSKYFKGAYLQSEKLSEQINYLPAVLHPFINPSERYIIFDAQPPGQNSNPDLYTSFRNPDGSWTKAENMGKKINISREMCPFMSPDGKFLFFARDGDIYWVDAEVIKDIKNSIYN